MGFWAALQFLTILPTPPGRRGTAKTCGESLAYFSLVGLIIGAILLGFHYGLRLILPSAVVNALVIVALVVLTGAHHLDGLMDTFDGVIAGKTKRERLAIMSDTRIGTFGIISAILVLLVKYISLSSASILPALLLMPTLSRWTMVNAVFLFPYAKRSGMGIAFKEGATWQRFAIATAIAFLVAVAAFNWRGLAVMAALWLITFGIAGWFRSRVGGLTGDNYGAINEMAEVLALLLVIAMAKF